MIREGFSVLVIEKYLIFPFSAPSLLMPLAGTKASASTDKYAVFKGIAADKSSENTVPFGGKNTLSIHKPMNVNLFSGGLL